MRDIVVGHRQDGNLGDGAISSRHTASSFVDGRQISVHVTRETTTTRNFFSSGGNLTKGIAVGRQVCQDDQNVLLKLVGVVLGCRKGKARGNDTLDTVEMSAMKSSIPVVMQKKSPYVGSLAKLRKSVVRSKLPFSSKSRVKNRAVSKLTPMAPNTMEKFSSWPS